MPDPYPGPNEEVLEAQARVCTGPHQSRPLGKKRATQTLSGSSN